MALSIGTRVGPYEVVGELGAGAMGQVYRAHHRKLGRDVALKVLPARPGRRHRRRGNGDGRADR